MNFAVPQYVDIEDKIAFRLTLKQLGWFGLAGLVMFLFWYFFEFWVFVVASVICLILAALFAFFRPAGLSLFSFLMKGVLYSASNKILWWDKGVEVLEMDKKPKKKEGDDKKNNDENYLEKKRTMEQLESIASILDEKSGL